MSGLPPLIGICGGTPDVRAYLRAAARRHPPVRPLLAIAGGVMLLLTALVA